jgi:hypothetical protein
MRATRLLDWFPDMWVVRVMHGCFCCCLLLKSQVSNEVDFEALCVCTDLDLEEIGILKGPRIKIASALRRRRV